MVGFAIGLLYMILSVFVGSTSCGVSLNSTVINGTVYLGDTVTFYCRTVGSRSLAWRSDEYIGRNGQQLSLFLLGSINNSFANATLHNSYLEDGLRVLESTLTLIAQGNIPSASMTCYSIGTDEFNTTSFNLAENPMVKCGNPWVCPRENRTFICETRGSSSLAWESEEYIGPGGLRLSFSRVLKPGETRNSSINQNVSATLMMNSVTNGVRVLRSELTVVVSNDILDDVHHMITCVNVGLDTKKHYALQLNGDCYPTVSTESETTTSRGNIVDTSRSTSDRISKYIIIGAAIGVTIVLGVVILGIAAFGCWRLSVQKKKGGKVSQTESFDSEKQEHIKSEGKNHSQLYS